MLIKEYRIPMPMTTDEYHIAQLYMVARASQEESGQQVGEGVEIVRNEPFDEKSPTNKYKMPPGQYTEKIMHLKSKLPKFIAMLLPDSMTNLKECSWNSFPWVRTDYLNDYFGAKFHMSVETIHIDDRGTKENELNLREEDLSRRVIDFVNIADDASVPIENNEDPTKFVSTKTGRGNLGKDFRETHTPIMTCYKVVKFHFKLPGLQTRTEAWAQQVGIRNTFLKYHRKIFCWIDEWHGLTIDDIRLMEEETARITKQKIEQSLKKQSPVTKRNSRVRSIWG